VYICPKKINCAVFFHISLV